MFLPVDDRHMIDSGSVCEVCMSCANLYECLHYRLTSVLIEHDCVVIQGIGCAGECKDCYVPEDKDC